MVLGGHSPYYKVDWGARPYIKVDIESLKMVPIKQNSLYEISRDGVESERMESDRM